MEQIFGVWRASRQNLQCSCIPEGEVPRQMRPPLMRLITRADSLQVRSDAAFVGHGHLALRAARDTHGEWRGNAWTGEESEQDNSTAVRRVLLTCLFEPKPVEIFYAAASRPGGFVVRRHADENKTAP